MTPSERPSSLGTPSHRRPRPPHFAADPGATFAGDLTLTGSETLTGWPSLAAHRGRVEPPFWPWLCLGLLALGLVVAQLLVGGTRLLFSIPSAACLALAALSTLAQPRRFATHGNGADPACLAAAVGLAGYVALRAWASPVAYLARPDLVVAGMALVVYLLTAQYLTEPSFRWGLLAVLLAMVVLHLYAGARQWQERDPGYMWLQLKGTVLDFRRPEGYGHRASGLYICPNHLAGYLEVVGAFALAAGCWARLASWTKLLLIYAGLASYAGLVLTGSRAGFLSAGAGLVTLAVLSLWRIRTGRPGWWLRSLVLTLFLALLAVSSVNAVVHRSRLLQDRAEHLIDTGDIRVGLWRAAWRQFTVNPLVGTGSGTTVAYQRQCRDPQIQLDPIHAHSDYLEFLAEYGAVGAAGMLLFLSLHLAAGFRTFLRWQRSFPSSGYLLPASQSGALTVAALGALVTLLVHSAFDFNLHIPANTVLLAFVCGVLAHPGIRSPARGVRGAPGPAGLRSWTEPRRWARWLLPALGVVLLVAGLPRLPGEFYAEEARTALRDQRYFAAIASAARGRAADAHNPDVCYYLGEARFQLGQRFEASPAIARTFFAAAEEPLQAGARLFPSDSRLLLRLGATLSALDQFEDAERVYRQALWWDPNWSRTWAYYGAHLQRAGSLEAALSAYRRSQELGYDPLVVQAVEVLAASLPPSGDGADATPAVPASADGRLGP